MRAQNRLIVFAARYVSVVTSEQQRLGGWSSSERTLILPGDVRYELDLSKLQPKDVDWDGSAHTLTVEAAGNRDRRTGRRYQRGQGIWRGGVLPR